MQRWLILLLVACAQLVHAQGNYNNYFTEAYSQYPQIPKGILEAVAYTNTHIRHITAQEELSCMGTPQYLTVMGLIADGKGVFRETLPLVADRSGIAVEVIKSDPGQAILAYAAAFSYFQDSLGLSFVVHADVVPVLLQLSELPMPVELVDDYAVNSQLYAIYSFLNDADMQQQFSFPDPQIDMQALFGSNLSVLSAPNVSVRQNSIQNGQGQQYGQSRLSTDYANANWNPAASCNYSSRNGAAITAVTVHTMQGSYAGSISWFQNCAAGVSAHYMIRSSDGQITQMVLEGEKAWHVGSANIYTIGLEHEGFVTDPTWYTTAMYTSSAALVKDITQSGYGIPPLSCYKGTAQGVLNECYRIKGHSHFPSQTHTDPGVNWNWPYYYSLINDELITNRFYTCNGTFNDNGGTGNYLDLHTYLTVIEPLGADSITMQFSSFALEQGYDSLYIYDGDSTTGTLIGGYTGNNGPGTVIARSGKMALLFKSDCSVNEAGWEATWQCGDCQPMYVSIDQVTAASCTAGGSVQLSGQGGNGSYSYTWSDGPMGATRNGLSAGTYQVTMTDASSCPTSASVVIPQGTELQVSIDVRAVSCFGEEDGVAALLIDEGTAPYSYVWGNGITDAVRSDLPAGVYSFSVTDGNGCEESGTVTITTPDVLMVNAAIVNDPDTAWISGGVGPYVIDHNCENLPNLDRCDVSIADANGCVWDTTVVSSTVGIANAHDKTLFRIYPAPATKQLNIELKQVNATITSIKVVNIVGDVLYLQKQVLQNGTISLDIRNYPTGMYFVQLTTDAGVYTQQIQKI